MTGLAGRLRQRVTLERKSPARDALGGSTGEWLADGQHWAELAPGSAERRWTAMMRRGPVIEIGDRLVWKGRLLRVTAAIADPWMPDRLRLACEEMR